MIPLDLAPHAEGTVIPVLAQPGAKRAGLLGIRQGALRLAVAAPADKGKANDALIALLADLIACKRSAIRLLTGPTSRQKRFLVVGIAPSEVRDRLATVLPPAPSTTRHPPSGGG